MTNKKTRPSQRIFPDNIPPPPEKAKTLIFDIETTPNSIFSWGVWEQNAIKVIKEWEILCFSYKWDKEKKIRFIRKNRKDKDDKRICNELWKLFDKADVIVAHNGNSFDIKKAQARFLHHQFPPPSPFKPVDTKLLAKRKYNMNFYNLDELAKYMGSPYTKLKHKGFEMWEGCMNWNEKSWREMERYNRRDVQVLDWVYQNMRAWDNQHPAISREVACQHCGSKNLKSEGHTFSFGTPKKRYSCGDCGGFGQYTRIGTKNI